MAAGTVAGVESMRKTLALMVLSAMFVLAMLPLVAPPEAPRRLLRVEPQSDEPQVHAGPSMLGSPVELLSVGNGNLITAMRVLPPRDTTHRRVALATFGTDGARALELVIDRDALTATRVSDHLLMAPGTQAPRVVFSPSGRIAMADGFHAFLMQPGVADDGGIRKELLPSMVGNLPVQQGPMLDWDATGSRLLVLGFAGFDVFDIPYGAPMASELEPPLRQRFSYSRPDVLGGRMFVADGNVCVVVATHTTLEAWVCRSGSRVFQMHHSVAVSNNLTYDNVMLVGNDVNQRLVRCIQSGRDGIGSSSVAGFVDLDTGEARFRLLPADRIGDSRSGAADPGGSAFVTTNLNMVRLYDWPLPRHQPTPVEGIRLGQTVTNAVVDRSGGLILASTYSPGRLLAIPIREPGRGR